MSTATIPRAEQALVEQARRYVGIRELTGNRGVHPDFFNARAFLGREDAWQPYPRGMIGAPWCATFAGHCGQEAIGVAWPIPRELVDVDKLVQWAMGHGVAVTSPRPHFGQLGDLLCVRHGDHWGHVAIVAGAMRDTGVVPTVEGNTNTTGSPNGDGVYELERRTVRPADVLIRWGALL